MMRRIEPGPQPAAGARPRAIVVQHVAFEDLGTLGPALEARGFALQVLQSGVDDLSIVLQRSPELLVVLGGPIGAYERDTYPWLAEELDVLATRLARGRPTLGICLGAQLMAMALGARVYAGTNGKEIGWGSITTTDQAPSADDPLAPLFAPEVQVLHWHGDTFDLPARVTHLAASDRYHHQAFAVHKHSLALQFHAEVTARQLERWYIGHAVELSAAGISVPELRRQSQIRAPRLERAAGQLWSRWLGAVADSDRVW